MRRGLRVWWPVLAWVVVIGLSTSVPVVAGPWGRRYPHLDKLVHFTLYLGLGWTLGRAMWLSGRRNVGGVLPALFGALGFAAVDEWHQRFIPRRSPSGTDWLADAGGVSVGLLLYFYFRRQVRDADREGGGAGVEGGEASPNSVGGEA